MSADTMTIPAINDQQATAILQEALKECRKCMLVKPLSSFNKRASSSDGHYSRCRQCTTEDQRLRRIARSSKMREQDLLQMRQRAQLRRYGVTPEQYQQMLEQQNWGCAICGVPVGFDRTRSDVLVLDVDHCHRTGKVRGLLCGLCNRALGAFWDSTEMLKSAIRYLEAHPETTREAAVAESQIRVKKLLEGTIYA